MTELYTVQIADDWTGATLQIQTSSPTKALDYAALAFAHDRQRAGLAPVDLNTLRWNVVGTDVQWDPRS